MASVATDKEHFRDSISTVDQAGKRVWLYPKKPSGKLYEYRKWVSYALLALLFTGPFLRIHDLPVLMLNFPERKFIIMGMIFWPQDFFILLLASLTLIVFIILFTVVYGRVFCGWVCPQTIFLEMVFRRIEYFFEGDAPQQKALARSEWNWNKTWRKGGKTAVFLMVSFFIANTFLAYIIGSEATLSIMSDAPGKHVKGLASMAIFTGVFYWVFAYFREQVCTVVCPYGRLQGVMLDKDSIVVGYDYLRGEPREKLHKNQARTAGDCIDCHQCVQVCPMGIDIRNGTQLECTNCTACIDVCNNIMDLINKPHGLIRMDSENHIAAGTKFKVGPRIIGYSAVLLVLAGILTTLILTRSNVEATVLRTPGQMFQRTPKGTLTNLYNISVINKTNTGMSITLKVLEPAGGTVTMVGNPLALPAQGKADGVFFAELPANVLTKTSNKIRIGVYNGGKLITEEKTKFLAPGN
jgi:cytochrome c oxidase accessory protein FixG